MSGRGPTRKTQVLFAVLFAVLVVPALFGLLLAAALWLIPSHTGDANHIHVAQEAGYVGSSSCLECHTSQYEAWSGSHHDLAMQPATEATVLGDFDNAVFEHRGIQTRFFRRDGRFMVKTENSEGRQQEFVVGYTFGAVPLQQYLLGFPDGRYQVLTVAWDSRSVAEGGARWFHIYPDEETPAGDELHWTAPAHTWNFSCAECHSTDLRKNYDPVADHYATAWAEIDVSCEACHGPGSRHVAFASAAAEGGHGYPTNHGLVVRPGGAGEWRLEKGAATAWLVNADSGDSEVESCGRCHSRRSQLSEYVFGVPLLDTHRLQLLEERLYFPDGQIRDEVFVHGSFLQSRMHEQGVTCGDCHDPHSLKLRKTGNALCGTCHAPSMYDSTRHHHHAVDSEGAMCVECHMPARYYMVVDARRDHSMRIPRPDLSVELGVPNACSGCHVEEGAQWAADAVDEWYGSEHAPGHQTYARALHRAHEGSPGAGDLLSAVVLDESAPAIARATALWELGTYLEPRFLPAIRAGLDSSDALLRRAAVDSLEDIDVGTRWAMVSPLLGDPVRGVRLAAASALLDVRAEDVDEAGRDILLQAFDEFVASERLNSDRAEHWVNLARFHMNQAESTEAEQDFVEARRRDPRFVPIYVNQADMYRSLGREAEAEQVLREGLTLVPESAPLHHSLGLLLVRTQRRSAALSSLAEAYRLEPADARLGYVYGVALNSMQDRGRAIEVWESVVLRHPHNREVLYSLAVALLEDKKPRRALVHAERLAQLSPGDVGVSEFVADVRRAVDEEHRD